MALIFAPLASAAGLDLGINSQLGLNAGNASIHSETHAEVKTHHNHRMKMRTMFRSAIEEKCGEREDSDEWKSCAREARKSSRSEFRTNMRNRISAFWARIRTQLQTCVEIDTVVEMRSCIQNVITVN